MEKERVIKLFATYDKKYIDSPELLKKIIALGFRTGSTLWGIGNDDSDIDIVLSHKFLRSDPRMLLDGLDEYFIKHFNSNYDGEEECIHSFYSLTTNNKKVINLIVCTNDKQYNAWKAATDVMSNLINSNIVFKEIMKNKTMRVELFENFKDYYSKKY